MINLLKIIAEIILNLLVKMGVKATEKKRIEEAIKDALAEQSDSVAQAGELRQNEKAARDRLRAGTIVSNFVAEEPQEKTFFERGAVMTLGIKETLEVIDFGLAIGEGLKKSLDDGKVDASDFANFGPALMAIIPALDGVGGVVEEIKDIDTEEMIQIKDHILAKADWLGEKWVVVANEAVNAAIAVYKIYKAFKA